MTSYDDTLTLTFQNDNLTLAFGLRTDPTVKIFLTFRQSFTIVFVIVIQIKCENVKLQWKIDTGPYGERL